LLSVKTPSREEADTTTARRVLIVAEEANREIAKSAIGQWALEPVCCSSVQEARALLPDPGVILILCEEQLVDGTYGDMLRTLGRAGKNRFVVISETPDADDKYEEAMQMGAFEVIASPCRRSDVQWIVIRAIHEQIRRRAGRNQVEPEEGSLPAPSESKPVGQP